jgi:tetratricopeptide (TPR) repeat protein
MNFDEKLKYGNQLIKDDNYLMAFDVFCELSYERPEDKELSKKALYLYNKILEGNYDFEPQSANQFLFRGVSMFYKGEFDSSNIDYDKALSLNSKLDIAHYNKGLNYGHLGNFDLSIKELKRAIALNPNPTYYNELAQHYCELGNYIECFKYHEKAIEIAPSNAFFWHVYGVNLYKGGLHANALLKLKRAVELEPNFEEAKVAMQHVISKLSEY